MIFLRKSSLRAAVFRKRSGGITVWLALCFLVFLSLYQICLMSVWKQFQRQRAEQTVEAGMFSLFSEYERHLLDEYDLFYVDASFRSGTERQDELCSHLWHFVENNVSDVSGQGIYGLHLEGVNVKNLVRATDGRGAVFYRQAVQIMKEKTGVSLAEDWIVSGEFQETAEEGAQRFEEDCGTYGGSTADYGEEEETEAVQWDGLWNSFTLSRAVPGGCTLSEKAVNLTTVPSRRELSVGTGKADGTEDQILQKQWFLAYLCEYMKHAQEMLPRQRSSGSLDYQLEYIINGKASDGENLEQTANRILLMREGINYLFLLSHQEFNKKAELLADALAGITGNPAIIEGVKHLILLGWAYGESLVELRQLLGGYELAVIKSESDWQVPLSGLLSVLDHPDPYDAQVKRQTGVGYEGYLRLFLMLEPAETLAMRALDIIEGELRNMEGCGKIHMDHCVESLTGQVWFDGICLERTFGYE